MLQPSRPRGEANASNKLTPRGSRINPRPKPRVATGCGRSKDDRHDPTKENVTRNHLPNQIGNHEHIAEEEEEEDGEGEWRPEDDAIVLLKSRLTVDNRELIFFVRQYPSPASFFTVQIQMPSASAHYCDDEDEGGAAGEEKKVDWCAFFPVTATMMSLLNMWMAHPSFEDKALLGRWLVQALQIEFHNTGGIKRTAFDEALLESACFREFQQFYDVLACRIQHFFLRHRNKLARAKKHHLKVKRKEKKGEVVTRTHKNSSNNGEHDSIHINDKNSSTPTVQPPRHRHHYKSAPQPPLPTTGRNSQGPARLSPRLSTSQRRTPAANGHASPLGLAQASPQKLTQIQMLKSSPRSKSRGQSSPGKSGGGALHTHGTPSFSHRLQFSSNQHLPPQQSHTVPSFSPTATQQYSCYFPPLLPNSAILPSTATPAHSSRHLDSSSLLLADQEEENGSSSGFDHHFDSQLDYFHSSIMSLARGVKESGDEQEEHEGESSDFHVDEDGTLYSDSNSVSFFPPQGVVDVNVNNINYNNNRGGGHYDLLLVPPSSQAKVTNTTIYSNGDPSRNINLSTAVSSMMVDEQIARRTRLKQHQQYGNEGPARNKLLFQPPSSTHHQHASRIQAEWRRGVSRVELSQRVEALHRDLHSEKKMIDSQSISDALRDCVASGRADIAVPLLERILEIIKTYDKKSARDFSIYFPQTVREFSVLVDALFSFLSLRAVTSLGIQILYLCVQKNAATSISDTSGAGSDTGDIVTIMGSANVCDFLMLALNRHASVSRVSLSPTGNSDDGGKEQQAQASLCKDIIQLQVLLTCGSLDNQLRLNKRAHGLAVLTMLSMRCGIFEQDKDPSTPSVLALALQFISYMCKASSDICLMYHSLGVFDSIMSLLRKLYKRPEAISIIFGFISVLMTSIDEELFKAKFGSPLCFIVYTDCLVAHRLHPQHFKLVCHVLYRLCRLQGREGEGGGGGSTAMLAHLSTEYFALASSAIMADLDPACTDPICAASLFVLLKKLRGKYAPLNELLEANGTNALCASLASNSKVLLSSSQEPRKLSVGDNDGVSRASSESSLKSLSLFDSNSFGQFTNINTNANSAAGDQQDNGTNGLTVEVTRHVDSGNKEGLSDHVASLRIQYLARDRFIRLKRQHDFREMHKKADILIKLVPKSNYFDQIVDALQTSLSLGHIDLAVLALQRILTLIEESNQMQNSSLVAKTFIKNPKILIEVSSSFLSIKKVQLLVWQTIIHLPFRQDVKTELDTLAMANVSGTFYWVLRRFLLDRDVLELCLSCAVRLTTTNVIMQDKFGKESGLRVLARAMMQHSDIERPILCAAELITNICATNVRNQQRCCALGVSHQLAQGMIRHLHNPKVVGGTVTALISLCGQKNSQNVCSHMCFLLTSLTSGLGGGDIEANMNAELQQSVLSVELTAVLDKLAADGSNANQEVVQTITMLVVHILLNFPSLRLKFLNDGMLRVLPIFIADTDSIGGDQFSGSSASSAGLVEWSVPVSNAAKLARNILNVEKSTPSPRGIMPLSPSQSQSQSSQQQASQWGEQQQGHHASRLTSRHASVV